MFSNHRADHATPRAQEDQRSPGHPQGEGIPTGTHPPTTQLPVNNTNKNNIMLPVNVLKYATGIAQLQVASTGQHTVM